LDFGSGIFIHAKGLRLLFAILNRGLRLCHQLNKSSQELLEAELEQADLRRSRKSCAGARSRGPGCLLIPAAQKFTLAAYELETYFS
jgi:hypothetical protein